MTAQSESILEQNLIGQLASNGYEKVVLKDEKDLLRNLKSQPEKHNNKSFSDSDFQQILNHLTKTNNVFEKAKILRDKFSFRNERNEVTYVESGDVRLRSKRELIEKFIHENLPLIAEENIEEDFETFMGAKKQKAFDAFVAEQNLDAQKLWELIEAYLFSQALPRARKS